MSTDKQRTTGRDRTPHSVAWRNRVGPSSAPPIRAVIIGINEYASNDYDNLNGAAADADAFEAFLTHRLEVPDSNICSLRDETASRKAIISSIQWLQKDIQDWEGEVARIFYFAGHEMLCPNDIGTKAHGNAEVVRGIEARRIFSMLNRTLKSVGDHITVILDCCWSGRMLGGITSSHMIRRSHYLQDGSLRISGGSYALLVACGRDQRAFEYPTSKSTTRRGLFTERLLEAFHDNDFNDLTYVSLMHRIRMPKHQTPHCEGDGIYRRLFNNWSSRADESLILTNRVQVENGQQLFLQAGSAQGITLGSRFTAHKTNLIDSPMVPNPALSHLVVTSVNVFSSTLDFASDGDKTQLPLLFYSKFKERAAIRHIFLYSADRQWLETIFPLRVQTDFSVTLVEEVESCDLELSVLEGRVYFDLHNNELVTQWIGSRMRYTVGAGDIDAVRAVVKGSLHFYYHLTRTAPNTFKNVVMELKELKPERNEEFGVVFHPVGNNLIEEEPAKVVINEEAQLGMTIRNNGPRSLYPYLFYFDPTDLTIVSWYTPPLGGGAGSLTFNVDPPLPPNSHLTVGYGHEGAIPWRVVIPDGATRDVGFFRLFLSSQPAYFESILQQETPFWAGFARGFAKSGSPEDGMWAVQTATVVQVPRS